MKHHTLLITLFCLVSLAARAGVTTYQFTSLDWKSRVGATACDGVTDGFVCDKAASEYMPGYTNAEGVPYSRGVSVKTGTSGAGATSVLSFTDVRQFTVNFCQNASKGRGVIYLQVGDAAPDSIIVAKPATTGSGIYLRDSVVRLSTPLTGKVRFWVRVTENAININSLTIRANEGGSNPFTTASYQLVTDVSQLRDSDQIILGVHQNGVNYVMGSFDENVSQNNIHAIRARYDADRTTVEEEFDAIYTLRRGTTSKGVEAWYIQDELRYDNAFLVASGGQTKNRLALWNHLYDEKTYGDYGYWEIAVTLDGEATIHNLGNSASTYIQYNRVNNPTLFSCYKDKSQTAISIYRRVEAIGDEPAIVAPLVNFGDVISYTGQGVSGSRRVLINANRLTEDIAATLRHGEVFSLDNSTIDRDGDYLTISYSAAPGRYLDTLVLAAGSVVEEVPVMLHVIAPISVSEAVMEEDFTTIYLNDVVVTKKYDTYIFVRDETGSMLIYDAGDGTGHRYGSGLKNGDVLHGVCGKMRNYFGVPELTPASAWSVMGSEIAEPELVTELDSADVCRYVRIEDAELSVDGQLVLAGKTLQAVDAFNTGLAVIAPMTLDAIVFISWDELQLWVVSQHTEATAIDEVAGSSDSSPCYNIFGQRVSSDYRGIVIENQKKRLQ